MSRTVATVGSTSSSGSTGPIEVPNPEETPEVAILVDVTTATAGTLDIEVEWSNDGGTTWASADGTADTFDQISATGAVTKRFAVKGTLYRITYTIVTGPFAFSVSAIPSN